MRIHRLTQRRCESAMPTEVVIPATDTAVEAGVLNILRGGHRDPDKRSRLKRLKKLGTMADEMEKGAIIKRRTKWLIDGAGLALVVSPGNTPGSVRRSWIFRWNSGETVIGKSGKARRQQKRIGLGSLAVVDLKRARELAEICRRDLQEGRSPLTVRREKIAEQKVAELQLRTLRMAVDQYLHRHSAGWSRIHAKNWRQSFDHLGALLDIPVNSISRALVIQGLTPLWTSNPETGRRLRGRLEKVLAAATKAGWRDGENPATWKNNLDLEFRPRSQLQPVKPHDDLPYRDAPAFMTALRAIEGVKARGLELLILSGVRTGEICSALGEHFDLDAATWTIPPARQKTGKLTGKEHIVPLSPAAIACLRKVEVVPGRRVFDFHDRAMYRLNKQIRKDCSGHGWRAVLSTWANEQTDFAREIIEATLAHQVGNDVERRYRRTTWIDRRRMLLGQWADFLSGKTVEAENVVELRRG
jgi:integrase